MYVTVTKKSVAVSPCWRGDGGLWVFLGAQGAALWETVVPSEISQLVKDKCHMISPTKGS